MPSHTPTERAKNQGIQVREPCPPGQKRDSRGNCVQDLSKVPKSNIANLPVGSPERGFFLGGKKVSQEEFNRLKDVPRRLTERGQQEQQQAGVQLEEAGAFEDVTPTRTELSPELETDIPFITPPLAAASQTVLPRSVLGILRDKKFFPKLLPPVKTGEEAFPDPETPETLREAALRQISINQFNEGVTEAERFGAFMETLPGFGFIDQWVSGVVEAPFGNAEDVLEEIKDIGDQATNAQEKTRSGIMAPAFALKKARDAEERIAFLEGRLKLLVSQSKILLANTDQVNVWEAEILDGKERIDNLRTAASFALTAELTGTGRIVPTDEQMFFELKEQNKRK